MKAESEATTAGLTVEHWTWADAYIGTKQALIEAGVLKEGQFPGDPGCGITSTAWNADGTRWTRCNKPSFVNVHKRAKDTFLARVLLTSQAEESRRWAEQRRRCIADKLGVESSTLANV